MSINPEATNSPSSSREVKKWYKKWWIWVIVLLIGFVVANTSEETANFSPSNSVDVAPNSDSNSQVTVASTSAPTTTQIPTSVSTNDSTTTTGEMNPFGGNDPEDFLMPDVVCMTLQQAQDEIQDHGVFLSRSEDASGQDRMQLIDSNWVVIGQSPKPGTKFGEGDALLRVVKIGESTGGTC
jgi:PASTA domain